MIGILTAFVPIWAVVGVGWISARAGVLGPVAGDVLSRFVFTIAMPALLFGTLSRTPLRQLAQPWVLAFGVSTLVIGVAALLIGRSLGLLPADRVIVGMSASYVNSANLGIPVAVQILGDPGFAVIAALFQVVLITPTILLLIERQQRPAGQSRWSVALLPLRNPIIVAAALGVLTATAGWHPPAVLTGTLALLGGAAVPAALVALGVSLDGHRVARPVAVRPVAVRPVAAGPVARPVAAVSAAPPPAAPPPAAPPPAAPPPAAPPPAAPVGTRAYEIGVVTALKVVGQPLVAYLAGRYALGLSRAELLGLVLVAGLPTAQNAFVFATRYRLRVDAARDSVLASTCASMLTLSLIGYLLGPGR